MPLDNDKETAPAVPSTAAEPAATPALAADVVPPAEPTPAPDATDDKKFSDAFEEFGALADDLEAPKDKTAPPATAVVEPVVASAPAVETPATPAPAEEPTETPEALVARLQQELAALKQAPPAAATPAATPTVIAPTYSEAEQATLETYAKDWPEVRAGEMLIRREEYRDLVEHVFKEVKNRYDHLLPFAEQVETDTQYTRILALAPDYPAVRKPTLDWIDKQPEYLKKAFNEVVSGGSPEDVVDLINRFKKETSWQAPAVVSIAPITAPATSGMAEPAAAAKKAAAALKVVSTDRTAPTDSEDPNDFSGAFEEFTKVKK